LVSEVFSWEYREGRLLKPAVKVSPLNFPVAEVAFQQRIAPAIADESRIVGIREAKMAILASSSLKRSRTLPNCSREDRIRDGPFKCRR
jgi:hypothetical protein